MASRPLTGPAARSQLLRVHLRRLADACPQDPCLHPLPHFESSENYTAEAGTWGNAGDHGCVALHGPAWLAERGGRGLWAGGMTMEMKEVAMPVIDADAHVEESPATFSDPYWEAAFAE